MRKCLFILIVCSVCRFCVAQEYDTIREDTQNVTNSCYVLTKDFIDDIIFFYDSNNEHYSITVLLSAEGVNQVSALTDNFIQFIQMDTIPVKIPIFLAYSSLYAFEPIIYGYDWDGKFLLEDDNINIKEDFGIVENHEEMKSLFPEESKRRKLNLVH